MNEEFGKRVSVKDAEKYFKAHEDISNSIKSKTPLFQAAANPGNDPIDLTAVYTNSPKNAFVFDKELVIKMLSEPDADGDTPDYLMIHFAAKFEDGDGFKNGDPTLVILGCRKGKDNADKKISFLSMNLPTPGGEQPGGHSIAHFPPAHGIQNEMKSIEFTFTL